MGVGFVASALQRRGNSLPASAVHASNLLLLILAAAAPSSAKGSPDAAPVPATRTEQTLTSDRARAGQDDAAAREARRFVADVEKELRKLYVDALVAAWANVTDITPEHEAAQAYRKYVRPEWPQAAVRWRRPPRVVGVVHGRTLCGEERRLGDPQRPFTR